MHDGGYASPQFYRRIRRSSHGFHRGSTSVSLTTIPSTTSNDPRRDINHLALMETSYMRSMGRNAGLRVGVLQFCPAALGNKRTGLFISKLVAIPPIKIQTKSSAKPFFQYTLSPTCESVSTCQCETARVWSIFTAAFNLLRYVASSGRTAVSPDCYR